MKSPPPPLSAMPEVAAGAPGRVIGREPERVREQSVAEDVFAVARQTRATGRSGLVAIGAQAALPTHDAAMARERARAAGRRRAVGPALGLWNRIAARRETCAHDRALRCPRGRSRARGRGRRARALIVRCRRRSARLIGHWPRVRACGAQPARHEIGSRCGVAQRHGHRIERGAARQVRVTGADEVVELHEHVLNARARAHALEVGQRRHRVARSAASLGRRRRDAPASWTIRSAPPRRRATPSASRSWTSVLMTTAPTFTQSNEPLVPGSTETVAFIAPGSSGKLAKVSTSKPASLPNGFVATTRLSALDAVLRIRTRSGLFDWPLATNMRQPRIRGHACRLRRSPRA